VTDRSNHSLDALHRSLQALQQLIREEGAIEEALINALSEFLATVDYEDARLHITGPALSTEIIIAIAANQPVHIQGQAAFTEIASSIESQVRRGGKRILIHNTRGDTNWVAGPHTATETHSWSALCEPLWVDGFVAGTATFLKPGESQFETDRVALAALFASQLEQALSALYFRQRWRLAEEHARNVAQDNQDLAAILVHDLQGPLGNVVTGLGMAAAHITTDTDPNLAAMIDVSLRSSQQLKALVDSLLDISRLQAGHPLTAVEPVAVSDVVDSLLAIQAPIIEQREVRIERDLAPDLPQVAANQDVLQRILLNLVDNALRVSKRGQIITIRARVQETEQMVRICVLDQGPGIPPSYRERIFDKYERVEGATSSQGLGLGLAFCRLAVEAHGGRIWLEDTPQGGACFCLTLPLNKPAAKVSSSLE
jgi:signal transduction histidine kinase